MKNYVTEFVGTFFLVLTVGLTVVGGSPMAPLAIGASLMVMVYMGGHVSGGHYNPAVTLAVFLRGKLSAANVVPYMISQVAGGFAAAAVTNYVMGRPLVVPPPELDVGRGLCVEFLYTFALALMVLNTATSAKTANNSFYGLAIGFTVTVGAFAAGGVSGGAFNPAVASGPILFHALQGGSLAVLWVYLVGQAAGAVLAAGVFKLQES